MILTLTLTHEPATDLGFLLHKHPGRVHEAAMRFGKIYCFFPEATEQRCTAAVMLEIDPVALVRGRVGSSEGGMLDQYVNDRPYAASSFLSSALTELFGTAMSGRSKERQELADSSLPFEFRIPVLPCRGGLKLLKGLFEPLGYEVLAEPVALDERFPEWGDSPYLDVTLRATGKLADLLSHLYVLIPVLDDDKHYWVSKDEIDKLLRRGEGWLSAHPMKEEITLRYLSRQRHLMRLALAQLLADEGDTDADEKEEEHGQEEERIERKLSLHDQRLDVVAQVLKELGARSILDLGCGEGKLLQRLLKEMSFERIVGMDVSHRSLEIATRRLKLDRLAPRVADRLTLLHGSLMYRDQRLEGFDAAAVVEVIEHLDAPRLAAFERSLFEFARPRFVVVTTPNVEYNVLFEGMEPGTMRHKDHRFEWTRAEFEAWGRGLGERFGYSVEFRPLGPEDEERGAPTQMGIFRLT